MKTAKAWGAHVPAYQSTAALTRRSSRDHATRDIWIAEVGFGSKFACVGLSSTAASPSIADEMLRRRVRQGRARSRHRRPSKRTPKGSSFMRELPERPQTFEERSWLETRID